MSIRDVIKAHADAERLFSVKPQSHKDEHKRCIYVTADIYRHLIGPWDDEAHEARAMFVLADYQGFAAGSVQQVSLFGRKHRKAQLARMESAAEEVWEYRHQHPKPGIRAMARFAEKDTLIAFGLKPRSKPIDWLPDLPLAGSDLLHELLKLECEANWKELFPDHDPVHGEDASEYLTDYTLLP